MSSSSFETQLFLSRPYLTSNQIDCARQITIIDLRTYNQKTLTVIKFLTDICTQLQFPRKTLESAIYFYQRYHLFNKFETELCYTVATSSLILSCKQVETFKKVNEISKLSLNLRNILKINGDYFENYKKRIFQIELRLLESCNFDYRINSYVHIDEFIIRIGKTLSLDHDICNLAWVISFDILKLDILLTVPPHDIAVAALKVAHEYLHRKQWPPNNIAWIEVDSELVDYAFHKIVNFYINSFDICDLKNSMLNFLPLISIENFIEIKSRVGADYEQADVNEMYLNYDTYLKDPRRYAVRERRYVLSKESMLEEQKALKTHK